MPERTPRLELPLIQQSQAQKHVTHNEALALLDLIVQLAVEGFGANTPPESPQDGQVWALGSTPTGVWSEHAEKLAVRINGGWEFLTPQPGWRAVGLDDGSHRHWSGSAWVQPTLVADGLEGIGVNASFDSTNRLAISSPGSLFTHEGEGHQLKVNKATAGDTASVLFQTGWSGRAEMGTPGGNDFAIKVSPDGTTWHESFVATAASGLVSLPNGLAVEGSLSLPPASVTRAMLASSSALSVMGRGAGAPGAPGDIVAATDHQVLRRSGASVGFGAVALGQGAAVSGQLPLTNGGTGAANAAGARANLGLGTAATATVTTSSTDATAGRLLKAGDSATLLSASPALRATVGGTANARTLTTGASISGTPPAGFRLRFRAGAANTGATTIALDGGTAIACRTITGVALPADYIRTDADTEACFDGTFWVLGREVERGNNANGEYVRFADGTQICLFALVSSSSADTVWTFPAEFSVTPLSVSIVSGGTTASTPMLSTAGTTSLGFNILNVSDSRMARFSRVTAIGRWF